MVARSKQSRYLPQQHDIMQVDYERSGSIQVPSVVPNQLWVMASRVANNATILTNTTEKVMPQWTDWCIGASISCLLWDKSLCPNSEASK